MKARIHNTINNLINMGKSKQAGPWQGDKTFENYKMLVITNQDLILQIPPTIKELAESTGADREWAEEHFQERISGIATNPGESYKRWPYATFRKDDPYMEGKQFSHTYQERFWPKQAGDGGMIEVFREAHHPLRRNEGIRYELGDLDDVIKQLRDNPYTRQAYLPIFFPEDTGAKNSIRVPCTLGYYFWIDDCTLHCNYIIRSCDALRHFRNDIYLTGRLLQHIAYELDMVIGNLNMFIFNFHVFENDIYPLKKRENLIQ